MTEEQNKLAKTDAELAEEIERHLLAHCAGVPTPVIGIDLWAWKQIIAALREREPATEAVLLEIGETCIAAASDKQAVQHILKLLDQHGFPNDGVTERALKGKGASQGAEEDKCDK